MSEPGEIKKLDETVINRIAAGEIIQRPANALKELIENSLDAKSTNIQITVKNGGLKFLQIQDNGTGIRKEDFAIICERFTTSKLREFEDLHSINTYGFRGEALASISHIAHLAITSKTRNDICAYTSLYVDGVMQNNPKPVAGNQGTVITVEDLFYNMHVRKSSLRSPGDEYQKILDVVSKYAIHNPTVGFGLKKVGTNNNDVKTNPNSSYTDNIRNIYGKAIARELIEFDLQNKQFKFKTHGYITNVNYTSKKFIFLLFINNRLVDCHGLKKSIDQVYATYLPKNMHPFVYLSLQLDPLSVDVNVHPTKHEVHFMNEEQIVESITTALETKLLGSNNSRAFYTQTKLPGVQIETFQLKDKEKGNESKVINPKDLIRTDHTDQKLEKFFGAPIKKSEMNKNEIPRNTNVSINEEEFQNFNKKFLDNNEQFEDKLNLTSTDQKGQNKTIINNDVATNTDICISKLVNQQASTKVKELENKLINGNSVHVSPTKCNKEIKSTDNKQTLNKSFLSKINRVETELTSILELRGSVEENCHLPLRDIFYQHVFVGYINPNQALIQSGTKLFLCNTQKILYELFYQFILYNFQNIGYIKFSEPLSIRDLSLMALNLPESGWTEEDGDKKELSNRIADILTEKAEMLYEYFSLRIDTEGNILCLPLLLDNYVPSLKFLPMYILRLATEVVWDSEKECFDTFAKETALFYSKMSEDSTYDKDCKWLIEHCLYPAVKEYFIPPKSFIENAAILEIASLPNLYKVFERC